ncbi:hypothetical protein C8R46DRAFT_1035454 [Mycena filopes]|nr:hypothetical protein C8R46DRAFT_1035454 [Mycena filopes]
MSSTAGKAGGISLPGDFSMFIFNTGDSVPPWSPIQPLYGFLTLPTVNTAFQNVFQSLYHLIRLELGILVENQIFNSPLMLNQSIANISIPRSLSDIFRRFSILAASNLRASTSNATQMKEWADIVHMFNTTDRVPVINYLRSVPRLKPLGSAITKAQFIPSTLNDCIESHTVAIDTHGADIAHMKLSFARMHLALKKRGFLEEDDEKDGLESSITCTSGEDEKPTLLVHRLKQPDSYSAV